MGNSLKKNSKNSKILDSETDFDISLIHKGIIKSSAGPLSRQKLNELILVNQARLMKKSDDYFSNLYLGLCLYSQGFYDTAELHLTSCDKKLQSYKVKYVLGLISMHKQCFSEAFEYLNGSIKLFRAFSPGYLKLAEVCLKSDNLNKAKKLLKKVNLENAEVYFLKGMYLKKKGKLAKCRKMLKKCISLQFELGKSYFYLGDVYMGMRKWEKSLISYQNAVVNSKGIIQGFIKVSLAVLYLQKERFDLMIKLLKESLNYGPQVKDYIKLKGFDFSITKSDLLQAIEQYTKCNYLAVAKSLKPLFRENRGDLLSGVLIALSCYKLGKTSKSLHYFKKLRRYSDKISSDLSKVVVQKSIEYIEINKSTLESLKTEELKEHEQTFEYIDSPSLNIMQIPEFFISVNNFIEGKEIKRNKSFLIESEEQGKNNRSATPTKSVIKALITTSVRNEY